MSAIDWAYLGSTGGEGIEGFAAACLRQRYPDAIQTRPAQGDGGIDIYRTTEDGLVVWQIKKFTTPLTAGQKKQVTRSWRSFWEAHVSQGERIAKYHLATPWTPTDSHIKWFESLTGDAEFEHQWDGSAFFDGLSAEYPATFDRFFRGPNILDEMILAKAALAGLPIESSGPISMLEAARHREDAIRQIRDLASETYVVNSAVITTRDGTLPLPAANTAGILHRYEQIDVNRFRVETIVPKTAQSTETDPIGVELTFLPNDDADVRRLDDWRHWGVPLVDIRATVRQVGGPMHEERSSECLLSIESPPNDRTYPDLLFSPTKREDGDRTDVRFDVKEVTTGPVSGGIRVLARSPSGLVEVEFRLGSASETRITIDQSSGFDPVAVRTDIRQLDLIGQEGTFDIRVDAEGAPAIARTASFNIDPEAMEFVDTVASWLVELQSHATEMLLLPRLGEITFDQVKWLERLVGIYRGTPVSTTWSRVSVTAESRLDWNALESRPLRTPEKCGSTWVRMNTDCPHRLSGRTQVSDCQRALTATRLRATRSSYIRPRVGAHPVDGRHDAEHPSGRVRTVGGWHRQRVLIGNVTDCADVEGPCRCHVNNLNPGAPS